MDSPLWIPGKTRIAKARISDFMRLVKDDFNARVAGDYFALHEWAVANQEDFW